MAKRAGQIVISISAGTAQFVRDMETSKAKVRDFGQATRQMGSDLSHSVSQVQATSGALRVLEGGLNNNLRAAERFTASVLGLGPILQKAFPVIGGLAFAGLLVKLGTEVEKFYRTVRDAPEKLAGGFAGLNASLRTSNDALELVNARLDADIAKLEGKRQNTLAIALLEAKKAADDLADSLDRDLSSLGKVLDENKSDIWQQMFGRISDEGLREKIGGTSGFGGFRADVRQDTESGRAAIEAAAKVDAKNGNTKAVDAAIADLKQKLQKRYQDLLAYLDAEIAKQQKVVSAGNADFGSGEGSAAASSGAALAARKAAEYADELRYVRSNFAEESRDIDLRVGNYQRTEKKTGLEGDAEKAKQDRPFDDRMKALNTELDGVRAKMAAIGQGEAAETLTKGFTSAWKAIDEVNKALEKQSPLLALTFNQIAAVQSVSQQIAQGQAETAWKEKLDQSTKATQDRIASQKLLTDAIGKGYAATKAASVETSVISTVGKNYGDPSWMKDHAADVEILRQNAGAEQEAKHGEVVKTAIQSLQQQIVLEQSLARVQSEGAEAVRQATQAWKIRQMTMVGASKEQIQAERDLYAAQRQNASAENVAKLNEEAAAMQRVAEAAKDGAEAIRRAGLENKYAGMQRAGASPAEISTARNTDEVANNAKITEEAQKQARAYSDVLMSLEERKEALEKIRDEEGDTLQIEIKLRDIENERLKTMADMALQQGRAQDGVKAFFLDMQQTGQTAAKNIYDAMHTALDDVSNELANAITGQKTSWGKMFQGIGQQIEESSIKSSLQKGLGAIGKHFGIDGLGGKADGSKSNPFYVVMSGAGAGMPGMALPGGGSPGNGGVFGGGDQGNGVFSLMNSILKPSPTGGDTGEDGSASGGLGGTIGSIFGSILKSFLTPHATGGDTSPGDALLVGENGPEIMSGAAGHIYSNQESRRMLTNSAPGASYYIDARGTDPVQTEQRVRQSLIAVHGSAVATSLQANADQQRRMPSRS